MSFLVRTPGAASLLVDYGRPRTRSLGVPVGGAADRRSYALGNALVGNQGAEVALEVALAGPTLEATADHACVVAGAPFHVDVNARTLPVGRTFQVRAGDVLTIGATKLGLRGYLCVRGGFTASMSLSSRSAWSVLTSGILLECPEGCGHGRFLQLPSWPDTHEAVLRVLPGSHARLFPPDAITRQRWIVTPASNRMGLRLHGEPLPREPGELISAPVCPGTVQVTNDGQPIVLGVDAQTIGGYPRLAQVIVADLDRLAQLRPGDMIRFELVSLGAALDAARAAQGELANWLVRLRHSWY
jgi:antagonist of KipI